MLEQLVHPMNLAAHVAAGAIGLGIGLVPLASTKGGAAHRLWGRRFAWLAGVATATAALAVTFGSPPGTLVAVTLSAGYQFVGSLRALALRDRGPTWIDATLALAAISVSALLLVRMDAGSASFPPAIGYPTLGFVLAVALYDLSRHAWADLWRRRARPLDHGLKMTGVYFAMASAGAGNLLRGFQPWSQVLPSSIGMLVMIALAVANLRARPAPYVMNPSGAGKFIRFGKMLE